MMYEELQPWIEATDEAANSGWISKHRLLFDGPFRHRMVRFVYVCPWQHTEEPFPTYIPRDEMMVYGCIRPTIHLPGCDRFIPAFAQPFYDRAMSAKHTGKRSIPAALAVVLRGMDIDIGIELNERACFDYNIWSWVQDEGIDWDLAIEYDVIDGIIGRTPQLLIADVHPSLWNSLYVEPMLNAAFKPFDEFVAYSEVGPAAIVNRYLPSYGAPLLLPTRMVDWVITIGGHEVEQAAARCLEDNPDPISINHICSSAVAHRPIAAAIVTLPNGSTEVDAKDQVSAWAGAYFVRLRELSRMPMPLAISLPVLAVSDGRWKLMFVAENTEGTEVVGWNVVGDTFTVRGCYGVLAVIRWLAVHARTKFRDWWLASIGNIAYANETVWDMYTLAHHST